MVVKKERYLPISQEKYERIMQRYTKFLEAVDNPDKDPVSPYDPLSKKMLDELELIREVSKQLQIKKDEDISKAAKAAKDAEEEAARKETEVEQQEEKVE
ncbi:uncharacterized protein LOC115447178 [Manduca sexta]|uniref:uncharacterized protein LOC115447178 n=1 Tax=Manduca sexta TaxID=7130 RepID=UPI00188F9371|nr:uncharacterized protein LOC115447178 [Manduca sexta]